MSSNSQPNPNNASQIVLSSITLGKKTVYEAPEGIHGKNQFVMFTGAARAGIGEFILLRKDYDDLMANGDAKTDGTCDLEMKSGIGTGVKFKVVVVGTLALVTSAGGDGDNDFVSVVVRNKRLTDTSPKDGEFNVQKSTPVNGFLDTGNNSDFYPNTLLSGSQYTWPQLVNQMEFPDISGVAPTTWKPRNMVFDGVPHNRIADQIAASLFLVVGWDYDQNQITWANPGTDTTDNALLFSQAMSGQGQSPPQSALLAGQNSLRSAMRLPGSISVQFRNGTPPSNPLGDPFAAHSYTKNVTNSQGLSSIKQGLSVGEYIAARPILGAWANQATLDTVANDMAARYMAFISQPFGQFEFAGIWKFKPDGGIRGIKWECNRQGVRTTVRINNEKDWSPLLSLANATEAAANQLVVGLGNTSGAAVNSGSGTRYILTSPQPNVVVQVNAVQSPTDPYGEYRNASILKGSATGMLPSGMTQDIACVVENGAEFNQGTHWLTGNAFCFPGIIVGFNTDTPPKPRVAISAPNPYAPYMVSVTKDGGGPAPDPASLATYTYTVTTFDGQTLGTGITPWVSRPGATAPGHGGLWANQNGLLLVNDT